MTSSFHGSPFLVLLHNATHKHLGVILSVLGDFHAENVHLLVDESKL